MNLESFLMKNRAEIIDRCRIETAARRSLPRLDEDSERGIPLFVDQLINTLRLNLTKNPDVAHSATQHGKDLMGEGFTVAQVVHGYGDVCQAVTGLAVESDASISADDFRVLNRCLDDAIADAVTEFFRLHDLDSDARLGMLAHEVRNLITSATLTFDTLKSGSVGLVGATGGLLDRLLTRLGSLVDRSLADVRLSAGTLVRERIDVRRFLVEIEVAASLFGKVKGITCSVVLPDDVGLSVDADPHILSSIVINLVQNAVKFTRRGGHVTLGARGTADRVQIDVADQCGGLPPGTAESLFRPFEQRGKDRSGVGLGLMIARRGAQAHDGEVQVRDVPGTGCVFTVDLPRSDTDDN